MKNIDFYLRFDDDSECSDIRAGWFENGQDETIANVVLSPGGTFGTCGIDSSSFLLKPRFSGDPISDFCRRPIAVHVLDPGEHSTRASISTSLDWAFIFPTLTNAEAGVFHFVEPADKAVCIDSLRRKPLGSNMEWTEIVSLFRSGKIGTNDVEEFADLRIGANKNDISEILWVYEERNFRKYLSRLYAMR